jgi:hypothetical protein
MWKCKRIVAQHCKLYGLLHCFAYASAYSTAISSGQHGVIGESKVLRAAYRDPDVSKLIVEVSAHNTLLHFTLALTPLHSTTTTTAMKHSTHAVGSLKRRVQVLH